MEGIRLERKKPVMLRIVYVCFLFYVLQVIV